MKNNINLIIPVLLFIFITSASVSCDRLRLTDEDREPNLMDRIDTNRIDTNRVDTNRIDTNRIDTNRIDTNQVDTTGRP